MDSQIVPQVAQRQEALDSSPRRLAMCELRYDMAIQHCREMQPSTEPISLSLPATRHPALGRGPEDLLDLVPFYAVVNKLPEPICVLVNHRQIGPARTVLGHDG